MKERLSALLDGDLEDDAAHPVLEVLGRDHETRRDWDAYCLIGDVLRGEQCGDAALADRVMHALRDEPVVFAPVRKGGTARASRGGFVQRVMPIAASVMGMAVVGAVGYTLYSGGDTQLPVTPAVAQADSATDSLLTLQASNEPHRKYVLVHQGMSGGGVMPAAFQYVRSVSGTQTEGRP